MLRYNTLIVLLGVGLLGAAAGPIGALAVLRRRALVGDALAHATLPGLCLAFLIIGERSMPALLLGALASGLLGVTVLALLSRYTRIKEDAAIAIVLSVFFGAGLVLSRWIQNHTTTGSKAGLDSYILGKTAGLLLDDVLLLAGLAVLVLVVLLALYKEFQLLIFDRDFARVQGWPVARLDLLLLGLIAVLVVIGLPAVGVILVASLLILPAVAARMWTDRLHRLLVLSGLIGALTGVVGAALSASLPRAPAGAVIVLVAMAFFVVSAVARRLLWG
ncbi:MAG: metal ABC transporter permease [Planctomycetia bacterium]|nr:metal ABC transporter permease [Planctomycetia bacterium]